MKRASQLSDKNMSANVSLSFKWFANVAAAVCVFLVAPPALKKSFQTIVIRKDIDTNNK